MQRIVFRADDERTGPGGGSDSAAGVTASRHVTLVFPATRREYEQARAGGEAVVRHGDETLPGHVSAGPTEGSAYVATTDTQRRAWSLPDPSRASWPTAATVTAPGHHCLRKALHPHVSTPPPGQPALRILPVDVAAIPKSGG